MQSKNESIKVARLEKVNGIAEKEERSLRILILITVSLFAIGLIWALVLKLSNEGMLTRNYDTLKRMTLRERLEWDLIPFNYRGTPEKKAAQFRTTVLNCLVMVPFGVSFPYLFKRKRVLKGAILTFAFIFFIETLQLITKMGNFATEDFITNMASYFFGVIIYMLFFKRMKVSVAKIFYTVALIGCILTLSYAVKTTVSSYDVIVAILRREL
jgi:glycopeptide antibiotics resistance protein